MTLGDCGYLECLNETVCRQPGRLAVGCEPLAHFLFEPVAMCGLALMGPKRGDLAVKHIGDVHVVVGARAAHQPYVADLPRLQPLLVQQLRMGERVPGIGKDCAQGCLAGGTMIRMVPMETAPTPLGTPGKQPGWPHLADQSRDVPAQRVARLDAAVRVAKKPHVRHAENRSRSLLLGPSDPWDGRAGNLGIEPTGVPSLSTQYVTAVPALVQEATAPPAQK